MKGLQHELAYEAIASGAVDVIDIYTTDAQMQHLGLVVLDDDRGFFPRYDAVLLYRLDARERVPGLLAAIARLEGRIDEAAMIRANAKVVLEHAPSAEVARALVSERLGVATEARGGRRSGAPDRAQHPHPPPALRDRAARRGPARDPARGARHPVAADRRGRALVPGCSRRSPRSRCSRS